MGRKQRPLDPAGGSVSALARLLRQLREAAGLTYREMAEKSKTGYSSTTFSRAASGKLLTEAVVREFTEICGGTVTDVRVSVKYLRAARRQQYRPVVLPGRRRTMHPTGVEDAHDLLLAMQTVRLTAGYPSLRAIAREAEEQLGVVLPISSLGEILQGKRVPPLPVVMALAQVCGVREENLGPWRQAWFRARSRHDTQDALATRTGRKTSPRTNGDGYIWEANEREEWEERQREVAAEYVRTAGGDRVTQIRVSYAAERRRARAEQLVIGEATYI